MATSLPLSACSTRGWAIRWLRRTSGKIDKIRVIEDYLLAFFARAFAGGKDPILDAASDQYPEVAFKSK